MTEAPHTPHSPAHIVIKNLDLGATPEALSECLWATLGLDCPPECIRMGPPSPLAGMAFISFTRETLAEFLRRYLEGQTFDRRTLVVEAAKNTHRGNGGKHHPSMPKVNRPKVLLQK